MGAVLLVLRVAPMGHTGLFSNLMRGIEMRGSTARGATASILTPPPPPPRLSTPLVGKSRRQVDQSMHVSLAGGGGYAQPMNMTPVLASVVSQMAHT